MEIEFLLYKERTLDLSLQQLITQVSRYYNSFLNLLFTKFLNLFYRGLVHYKVFLLDYY